MRITYYTRDVGGLLTGPRVSEGWDSVDDFLVEHCRADETPEIESLTGYPDATVTWYGDLGIAGKSMYIDRLERTGRALYGNRWQSELARALKVGDRRIREWTTGDRSIPAGVWSDIVALLRARSADVTALIEELAA